jgi:hypothetical protein
MRIKIIGDNNCARATRHLLRKAGFAVTEFLAADVATQAPHSGYVIAIDLAPAPHPLHPTTKPDHPTRGQPASAIGEASPSHGGASSPTSSSGLPLAPVHFDSVDSELEAAILPGVSHPARGRKWWRLGLALVSGVALTLTGSLHASLRHDAIASDVNESRGADGVYLKSTAINDIFLSGCKYRPDFSLADCRSSIKTNPYSPYSLAVLNDSIAELLSGNAVALSSPSDRVLNVNAGKLGSATLSGANVVHSGDSASRVDCAARCIASRIADRASFLPAAALAAQGQFSTGQAPVKITDGTSTLVVDPCKAQTKLYVSINQTANTQLVAGTASKKVYICSIHVVVAVVTNVALVEGTGSVCATGTAGVSGFGGATAATGWNFAANGGIALGNGDAAVGAEGTNADNLCLFNSGSGQVSGGISYVVQ